MDRKQFLKKGTMATGEGLVLGQLLGCDRNESPNLRTLVRETDGGIMLDYEIVPEDPEERRENRFANYSFARSSGEILYSPLLQDERWLEHYNIIRDLFSEPLDGLNVENIDPLFGFFAYRVHPTTLNPRYHHLGIDLFKPVGTEVKSVYEGVVETNRDNYSGNWIKVKHPIKTKDGYNLESRYLHLENFAALEEDPSLLIREGDEVEKDQVIGHLGGTGIMNGYFPHLHFEVVMFNPDRPEFTLVLDPSRIYFDAPEPSGFFQRIFSPDQQLYFRSATRSIREPSELEELAETIKGMDAQDKRFLPLYMEFWQNAASEGNQEAIRLLQALE